MSSTGALTLPDIPERLLVVGGGYVGAELGQVYATLGSRVTMVEMMDRLMAGADPDLVKPLAESLGRLFEGIHLKTRVKGVEEKGDGVEVTFEGELKKSMRFDRILVRWEGVPIPATSDWRRRRSK
jgi:dihydrolipoamide dehydrogenase